MRATNEGQGRLPISHGHRRDARSPVPLPRDMAGRNVIYVASFEWMRRREGGRLCEFPESAVWQAGDAIPPSLPGQSRQLFQWATWKPPVRTRSYISSTPRTADVPAFVELDEMIRPPLHHLDALLPMLAPQIGTAHVVVFHMSQLSFDRVRMPFSAFVEQ